MVTIKIKIKQNYLDMLTQKTHHLNVGINQQEHDIYYMYTIQAIISYQKYVHELY